MYAALDTVPDLKDEHPSTFKKQASRFCSKLTQYLVIILPPLTAVTQQPLKYLEMIVYKFTCSCHSCSQSDPQN